MCADSALPSYQPMPATLNPPTQVESSSPDPSSETSEASTVYWSKQDRPESIDHSPATLYTSSQVDIVSLDANTIHNVLAFLPMVDRVHFVSTSQKLAQNGVGTKFETHCGACDSCQSDVKYFCKEAPQRQWTAPTWTSFLSRHGHTLTELHLSGCGHLFPAVFESPQSRQMLHNLRVLRIDLCSGLDSRALEAIVAQCHNLCKVHIISMPLDDAGVAALLTSSRATLRELDLSGCHLLEGHGLHGLHETQVESISLEGCHRVKMAELDIMFAACKTLRRLSLQYCHKVDDSVAESLATHARALKHLNLRYCCRLSDDGVRTISRALSRLETLDLTQCPRLTNDAVSAIAKSLHQLKSLKWSSCRQVSLNLIELPNTKATSSPPKEVEESTDSTKTSAPTPQPSRHLQLTSGSSGTIRSSAVCPSERTK